MINKSTCYAGGNLITAYSKNSSEKSECLFSAILRENLFVFTESEN